VIRGVLNEDTGDYYCIATNQDTNGTVQVAVSATGQLMVNRKFMLM